MNIRSATVPTRYASRYLQQLCKHFGHKVPVDFTPSSGTITLPFGTCELSAAESVLTLTVSGEDTQIAKLERVITDHLARFAFREAPTINWQSTT